MTPPKNNLLLFGSKVHKMNSKWIWSHCQLPHLSCMIFDNCDSIDYPLVRTARTHGTTCTMMVTMTTFLQLQNKRSSKTQKHLFTVIVFSIWYEQDKNNMTEITVFNASLTQLGLNCTWCQLWQGDECYQWRPCIFCNQTVPCNKEQDVCRDNVCFHRIDGKQF